MKTTPSRPAADHPAVPTPVPEPFRVVLLSASPACEVRATAWIRQCERRMPLPTRHVCHVWSFEQLMAATEFENALHAMSRANALVIAIPALEPLPPAIDHWLNTTLPILRERRPALLALLMGRTLHSPTETALQHLAHQADLSFAARYVDAAQLEDLPAEVAIEQRSQHMTSLLEDILHQTDRAERWGLHR